MAASTPIWWDFGLAPPPPVSWDFGLAALPASWDFGLADGVPVSWDFGLAALPVSWDFGLVGATAPADASAVVACAVGGGATILLTLPGDYSVLTLAASATGSAGAVLAEVTDADAERAVVTVVATGDDVYTLLVQEAESGAVVYFGDVAVLCAGQACFRAANRRAEAAGGAPDEQYRAILAALIQIPAAVAMGDSPTARARLLTLSDLCAAAGCGCGC